MTDPPGSRAAHESEQIRLATYAHHARKPGRCLYRAALIGWLDQMPTRVVAPTRELLFRDRDNRGATLVARDQYGRWVSQRLVRRMVEGES